MPRTKRSVSARKKRRKVLDEAKGYWGQKKSSYRRAKEQGIKSGTYAYRDRRARKREFRRLWITRINAGARENGLSYNELIHGLKRAEIEVDRKMLADLAVREPEVFAQMAARAKDALGTG
jgi:large subunit ribosomal protein L20